MAIKREDMLAYMEEHQVSSQEAKRALEVIQWNEKIDNMLWDLSIGEAPSSVLEDLLTMLRKG